MAQTLTTKQVKWLRSRAHPLDVVLKLGKRGLTDAVQQELNALLAKSELVKIRVQKSAGVENDALALAVNAAVVQQLGHTLVLYRAAEEPQLRLPV